MNRGRIITLVVLVPLVALIAWVASNTYWADTKVPMPPKGEALTNPFYAAQRFVEALGARSEWDRSFTTPPTDSVIVLSTWHWDLSAGRRAALEGWVESGGRLVIDRTLAGGENEFERWSGIVREYRERSGTEESQEPKQDVACRMLQEEQNGTPSSGTRTDRYRMCDLDSVSFLTSTRNAEWVLRDESAVQAMRVQVGRGSVTVLNATPFRDRKLFEGDHGWLLVAATQMRRGDDVHFLSEDAHPSLLALLWQHGSPAVMLTLTLLAAVLWRRGVRFGPLAAMPDPARRSLAEQICGTGQFSLRNGSGDALHAASVRALDEAAHRRIPMYTQLSADDRAVALARLTGFDRDALAAAVHHAGIRRSHELRNRIALLEAARRRILIEHTRFSHGRY